MPQESAGGDLSPQLVLMLPLESGVFRVEGSQ